MHNKVVFHTAKVLNAEGLPTLAFNFRGVGRSRGAYDHGRGETDDVIAAIDYLAERYPQTRLLIAGFSFGAWVGLRAACRDARVQAAIALGLPVASKVESFDLSFLNTCRKPKLFLQGTEDEFSPMADVERIYSDIAEPKRLVWIVGANHFFEGKFLALENALVEFLHKILLP